jgi:hypothetical protein
MQPGDEDLRMFSLDILKGQDVVVEEKIDGSNSGISFGASGQLLLPFEHRPLRNSGDRLLNSRTHGPRLFTKSGIE